MRNIDASSKRILTLLRLTLIVAFLTVTNSLAVGQSGVTNSGRLPSERLNQPPVLASPDSIKVNTDLISVAVTVTDRSGQAIAGLPREYFKVYDDKIEQPIRFFSDEDAPASIGILFDTSGSMNGDAMEHAKEALARFIQTSHPQDEFFLIGFDSQPYLLLDKVRDGKAVLDKFTYVQPKGNTALYDAVKVATDKVSQGAYAKRAIILISDGEENDSRLSLGNLRRKLQESGAVVYTVKVGDLPLPKSNSRAVMADIAATSGGKAFWPRSSDRMAEAFEEIALDLRRQYSLAYLPANWAEDGKRHRIKVVLAAPHEQSRGMVVRYREAYYAVANFAAGRN
jgi:Ca-activated chloride channel family protein